MGTSRNNNNDDSSKNGGTTTTTKTNNAKKSRTTSYYYATAVAAALVGIGYKFSAGNRSSPVAPLWHEGPEWERLLSMYDDVARQHYYDAPDNNNNSNKNCRSETVESKKFGTTQIHSCGGGGTTATKTTEEHVVFMLHGLSSSGLMWGDWLVPALLTGGSNGYYRVVTVDALCDMGRSLPRDGDPRNCPQTEADVAEWFSDVRQHVLRQIEQEEEEEEAAGDDESRNRPNRRQVSLVGYSYGSYLAGVIARQLPSDQVDKLVLMAPACLFAPISGVWLAKAVGMGTVNSMLGKLFGKTRTAKIRRRISDWFFNWMIADPDLTYSKDTPYYELREASDDAGPPIIPPDLTPKEWSDDELKAVVGDHPTLLVIGENETVTDASIAVAAAERAGAKVKLYRNSGHMLLMEHPRWPVVDVVRSFLEEA